MAGIEYSMLPRATHTRSDQEALKGQATGRTIEPDLRP